MTTTGRTCKARPASLGLIFAMGEEAAPALNFFAALRGPSVAREPFAQGRGTWAFSFAQPLRFAQEYAVSRVLACVSGVGTVNAAVAASRLVAAGAEFLLNVGTAGLLDESVPLGAPVIVAEGAYLHPDATAFGYAPGQIPGEPRS